MGQRWSILLGCSDEPSVQKAASDSDTDSVDMIWEKVYEWQHRPFVFEVSTDEREYLRSKLLRRRRRQNRPNPLFICSAPLVTDRVIYRWRRGMQPVAMHLEEAELRDVSVQRYDMQHSTKYTPRSD